MLPEAKFIKNEVVIREMKLTEEVMLTRRSLLRWLALSLGLINPRESRNSFIEVFDAFLSVFSKEHTVEAKRFIRYIKNINPKIHEKTIYYHLKRLEGRGFIKRNGHMLSIDEEKELKNIIKEHYQKVMESAFENIEKALSRLEGM